MDWTKHAEMAVPSLLLMHIVQGRDGQDYDLDNPDDMYLLAFMTAQGLVSHPEFNGLVGQAKDYPFQANKYEKEIRKMWDMGFEDGMGSGDEVPNTGESRIRRKRRPIP